MPVFVCSVPGRPRISVRPGSRSEIPCSPWAKQAVTEQRVSSVRIVRAFAAERSEPLRNVESQRLATLEWATAERREAIADVRREFAAAIALSR